MKKYTKFYFSVWHSFYFDGDVDNAIEILESAMSEICDKDAVCEVTIEADNDKLSNGKLQPATVCVTIDMPEVVADADAKVEELKAEIIKILGENKDSVTDAYASTIEE